MADQSNKPSIRFAGFTGPWEQRKFSNEFVFLRNNTLSRARLSGDKGSTLDVHYGDVLIKFGAILDCRKADLPYIADDTVADSLTCDGLEDGDIIIADTAEDLTAGKCSELRNSSCKRIFAGLHTMPCRPLRQYASGFLGHYLNAPSFHDRLVPLMQGIKVISISRSAMENARLMVPLLEEQARISNILTRLDDLITLHQRKYDKLVVFKKAMLEQMFPQEGETVPKIRFAGFTDPWEQRKLGEIAVSFDYGLNAAATTFDGENGYLRITDIDDSTRQFSKSDLTSPDADLAQCQDSLLHEGDIVFSRTGASVGKTYIYRECDGATYFAGFLIRMKIKSGIVPQFVFQTTLSETYKRYVDITSQRSGQPGVNAEEYADCPISVPSFTEQQAIGRFFSRLDDLITLHQRKHLSHATKPNHCSMCLSGCIRHQRKRLSICKGDLTCPLARTTRK